MNAKALLRQKLKHGRLSLGDAERSELSEKICQRLEVAVDWSKIRQLHCYEPMLKLGEVNTGRFLEYLNAKHPEMQLYTSRKISGSWRLIRTATGQIANDAEPEVVVVPMLGFDQQLHRIGFGGGYYDRFLSKLVNAQKIGVCFEQGKVDQLPTETHDIAMNMIITDRQIYT